MNTEKWMPGAKGDLASFGIGMTIVEPGGARTEFRYGSALVARLTPTYDQTSAHSLPTCRHHCPGGREQRLIRSRTVCCQ